MHPTSESSSARIISKLILFAFDLPILILLFGCSGAMNHPKVGPFGGTSVNCHANTVVITFDDKTSLDHDVVLCDGANIVWKYTGTSGQKFHVDFAPDDSPFPTVSFPNPYNTDIDSGPAHVQGSAPIASYKYTLFLGSKVFDPHVIVLAPK